MKSIKKLPILLKTLPWVILLILIKIFVFQRIFIGKTDFASLIEISDISIVFTGAFFVMGLLLAATMTDFKESEKIPGEIASHLEAIKDWIFLALRSPRMINNQVNNEELNKKYLRDEMVSVTDVIIKWIHSEGKDSKVIFPEIRRLNEIAYYFAERGVDKEAVKGIQENTNGLRKQLTRAYGISRNNFIKPAYILLKCILIIVFSLISVTNFHTLTADILITISIAFLFIYLYQLIKGLDDPFNLAKGDTEVDLKAIDRFQNRLSNEFLV